jgi:phosphatidylserine/phosphatidylglycerophosphate/cardiolipin synthase-like enzyme
MKKTLFTTLFLLVIFSTGYTQNTILEARQMGVGAVVTVTGIATNGSELGIIRYFQDETAGIAAYGSTMGSVNRGDIITVTGTLKNYYQLLEIDPVSSVVVVSTGNPLPDPILLTPAQFSEPYEGMLVQVNNVIFNDGGQNFTEGEYGFTANGEAGSIYIKNNQNMVGTVIPTGPVTLTGICSQFDFSNPNSGYQMIPRDIDDISLTSSIYLTAPLANTNFTQTELDFSWVTNIEGTNEMFYGPTEETVTENIVSMPGTGTSHSISLSGLNPGEITWVQAISVSGEDTASSGVQSFATISNSSGKIISYFNTPVDLSYSSGEDAIYLPETMDDTLIKYIERAKYTIDFTMYNFNNAFISNVSDALMAAADNGVRVRVIGCGTTANFGIDEMIGSAVHILIGPDDNHRTGIMHNKFIIFDAQSTDPNDPLVWTGSTNITDGQINLDANNVIIVQDQSLARAYQIEFEEMWGGSGDEPDEAKALFGSEKRNNTPHEFMIDGNYVECYFSPSDGVNSKIVDVINTANNDLSVATMLMTRTEMANAIADRKSAGVAVNVITNAEGNNNSTVNQILTTSLTTHNTFDDVSTGILHHKYMIVDQYDPASDPMVFTGSHNWSAAADNDNDENTLVVHNATLANVYYQQFVHRFVENLGVLIELTEPPTAVDDLTETGVDQMISVAVLENDVLQAPVVLTIEQHATHGESEIPFTNPNVINYQPADGFLGQDSVVYKIAYLAEPDLFDMATIYINVVDDSGIGEISGISDFKVFPNPVANDINLSINATETGTISLTVSDLSGKQLLKKELSVNIGNNQYTFNKHHLSPGIYLLKLARENTFAIQKLIVQ